MSERERQCFGKDQRLKEPGPTEEAKSKITRLTWLLAEHGPTWFDQRP